MLRLPRSLVVAAHLDASHARVDGRQIMPAGPSRPPVPSDAMTS